MACAIIQARMGSSRLPGKVSKLLGKYNVLEVLVNRLKQVEQIKDIILATSSSELDDKVHQIGTDLGINVYRGSESDVLDRLYQASKLSSESLLIRITGDCPLISPKLLDQGITEFKKGQADILHTSEKVAEGLDFEIFLKSSLKEAWNNEDQALSREHATQHFYNNDRYTVKDFCRTNNESKYRITLDELEDYEVLQEIANHFAERVLTVEWDEIKEYLDDNPQVFKINSNLIRNEGFLLDQKKIEKE